MCLCNTNAPDNGQFQRSPRSEGQISWFQSKDTVTKKFMCNMKALILMMSDVIFLKIGQMSRSKGLVPTEISYQKDYTYLCEISKL